jgi:RNA-directed DNA polymerase
LSGYALRHGLRYTRYADDLTFSGEAIPKTARRTIESIIRDEGFSPNERKRRFLMGDARQIVAGIVVNDRVNWPRSTRRWLRQEVHYLTKYGVDAHLQRRGEAERSGYKDFIYGHVYALHQVAATEAYAYLEMLDRVPWSY